jgi:hypothetical protein
MGPIELCPGRPMMEARALALVPALARITHAIAEQGIMAHGVQAQTLDLIYHGPAGRMDAGAALAKMAGALATLEPWAADACRRCVSYVVALVDQMEAEGYRVQVEIEMHLGGKLVGISRGGTADVVLLCFKDDELRRVVAEDTKTGFLDQGEAADHLQLSTYAVMAWDKYRPIEPIDIHLAQGRRREFSAARFAHADIEGVRARVMRAVAGAFYPAPELRPSIKACMYCKAITHCRAVREQIMHAAEELALFGDAVSDRVRLMEDAAIARRFTEEVKAIQKEWTAENQSNQARERETVTP